MDESQVETWSSEVRGTESINFRLTNLKKDAASNTRGLEHHIARTQQWVEHSVNIVHRLARELRPAVLDDLGLIPAQHALMKNFRKETGIPASPSAFAVVEKVNGERSPRNWA